MNTVPQSNRDNEEEGDVPSNQNPNPDLSSGVSQSPNVSTSSMSGARPESSQGTAMTVSKMRSPLQFMRRCLSDLKISDLRPRTKTKATTSHSSSVKPTKPSATSSSAVSTSASSSSSMAGSMWKFTLCTQHPPVSEKDPSEDDEVDEEDDPIDDRSLVPTVGEQANHHHVPIIERPMAAAGTSSEFFSLVQQQFQFDGSSRQQQQPHIVANHNAHLPAAYSPRSSEDPVLYNSIESPPSFMDIIPPAAAPPIMSGQLVPHPTASIISNPFTVYMPEVHTQIDFEHKLVPDLLEITSCGFYFGKIDRYEAERLLDKRPEGTFLLRDSAQDDFVFSLSFRRFDRSLHARIEQHNDRFSFDSHDPNVFHSATVTGLIEHYRNPNNCVFFEPCCFWPVHRPHPFSLQHLARSVVVSRLTYTNINSLPLPKALKSYLKEYHYRQQVEVRHLDVAAAVQRDQSNNNNNVSGMSSMMSMSSSTSSSAAAAAAPVAPIYHPSIPISSTSSSSRPSQDTFLFLPSRSTSSTERPT